MAEPMSEEPSFTNEAEELQLLRGAGEPTMQQLVEEMRELRADLTAQLQELKGGMVLMRTTGRVRVEEQAESTPMSTPRSTTAVDSIEDLSELLAENTDLKKLVTKVREAQLGNARKSASSLLRSRARERVTAAAEQEHVEQGGLLHATLHPAARGKLLWDVLQLLTLCYCLVSLPLVLAFEDVMPAATAEALRAVNATVDVLLLLDIAVVLRTAYVVEGVLVRNVYAIAEHYARRALLCDLLGAVPISLVRAADLSAVPSWLPLLFGSVRLLRFRRLAMSATELLSLFSTSSNASASPGVLRLGRLASLFFLSCHWIGCCWYTIGDTASDEAAGKVWGPEAWLLDRPWGLQVMWSFYWGIGMLTGIAPNEVSPDTPIEVAFSGGALVSGVILLALVVSSTTSAVSAVDAVAETHRRELDIINGCTPPPASYPIPTQIVRHLRMPCRQTFGTSACRATL